MKTVWQSFVQKSKASYIGIVAHSYGGVVTLDLVMTGCFDKHENSFISHAFIVLLTYVKEKLQRRLSLLELIRLFVRILVLTYMYVYM